MSRLRSEADECVILVKALPHLSSNYFETVCCAGMGRDHKWRRLYPVPFRILAEAQKFGRWNWISYQFTDPRHDGRRESQKVVPESIKLGSMLKSAERSRIVSRLTRSSTTEAESKGETLTLIKPDEISFLWEKKTDQELAVERRKHAQLVGQTSLLNKTAKPLEPCPYEFKVRWRTQGEKAREQVCDDWETSTAFFRRPARAATEVEALNSLRETYEGEYMKRGMRLALGTHSRRDKQWLLVGIIRADEQQQGELF